MRLLLISTLVSAGICTNTDEIEKVFSNDLKDFSDSRDRVTDLMCGVYEIGFLETCGIHGKLITKDEDGLMFTRLSNYCKIPNPCTSLGTWEDPSFIHALIKRIFNIKNFASLALKPIDAFLHGIPSRVIGGVVVVMEIIKIARSQPNHELFSEFCNFSRDFLAICDSDVTYDMPFVYEELSHLKTMHLKSQCSIYRDRVLLPTLHVCSALQRGIPLGSFTRKWNSDAFYLLQEEVLSRQFQEHKSTDKLPEICDSDPSAMEVCEKYLKQVLEPLDSVENTTDLAVGAFDIGDALPPPWMFPVTNTFFDSLHRMRPAITKGVEHEAYAAIPHGRQDFIKWFKTNDVAIERTTKIDELVKVHQNERANLSRSRTVLVHKINTVTFKVANTFNMLFRPLVESHFGFDVTAESHKKFTPVLSSDVKPFFDELSNFIPFLAQSLNSAIEDFKIHSKGAAVVEAYGSIASKMITVADFLEEALSYFSNAKALLSSVESSNSIIFNDKESFGNFMSQITLGFKAAIDAASEFSNINSFEILTRHMPRAQIRSDVIKNAVTSLVQVEKSVLKEIKSASDLAPEIQKVYDEWNSNKNQDKKKNKVLWRLWEMREKKHNAASAKIAIVSAIGDITKIMHSQDKDTVRAIKVWSGVAYKTLYGGDDKTEFRSFVKIATDAVNDSIFSRSKAEDALKKLVTSLDKFEKSETKFASTIMLLDNVTNEMKGLYNVAFHSAIDLGIDEKLIPTISPDSAPAQDDFDLYPSNEAEKESEIESFVNVMSPEDHLVIGAEGESAELKLLRLLLQLGYYGPASKYSAVLKNMYNKKKALISLSQMDTTGTEGNLRNELVNMWGRRRESLDSLQLIIDSATAEEAIEKQTLRI